MEGLIIQGNQQEEQQDAGNFCRQIGAQADAHKDQGDADGLCRDESGEQAEQPSGIGAVRKVQGQVFLEMVKHTVAPELAVFVSPQHAEGSDHTAAINNKGPQHPFRKTPVLGLGYKMNQRIANLLAEEQHEHGADCGQKDPTFGSDRVKTVEIRTGTVFSAVAGYQDQVVQGDQAADDTEGKTEHGFHETAAQMAVIGGIIA